MTNPRVHIQLNHLNYGNISEEGERAMAEAVNHAVTTCMRRPASMQLPPFMDRRAKRQVSEG